MASTIRIKRSGSNAAPNKLAQGELAYSYLAGSQSNGGDRLYIGTGTETNGEAVNIEVIGGKYFTDLLKHVPGTLTASSAILVDSNKKIDELLVDNLKLDGNTLSSTNSNGDILITPAGTGKTIISNLFIGDDETSLQDFIGSVSISGIDIVGTTNQIGVTSQTVEGTVTFTIGLDDLATSPAGTYGSATAVPVITVDAKGRVTGVTTESISTTVNIAGDDGGLEAVSLINDTLKFVSGATPGISVDVTRGTAPNDDKVFVTVELDQDLSTTGTPVFAEIDIDNINIDGNTISSTNNNGNINLTAAGTGVVVASKLEVADLDANRGAFTAANGRLLTNAGFAVTPNSTTVDIVVDGSFQTDNIRVDGNTISSVDTDGNIVFAPDGSGDIAVSGAKITNLGMPTATDDAATKAYVDEVAQGLRVVESAFVLVDEPLSATYDKDGHETDWATLTATSNGAFPAVDGVTSESLNTVGARILITAQADAAHNGLYVVKTVGDTGNPWVLRRCGQCRLSSQIPGSFVFVKLGANFGNTGWVATVTDVTNFTVGEDPITWVQFSGAGTFTAGAGLTLTGTVFSANVDNSTIEIDGSDNLRVKNGGITNAKLANSKIVISADTGSNDDVNLGETLNFSGSNGVATVVSDNKITINGVDATTSTKGVASFADGDFNVAGGAVSLKATVVKSVVTQSGTTTPANNSFTINGAGAISTAASNSTVTVSVATATTTALGVASFSTNNFAVDGGAVSAKQFTIGSTNLNLGGTTTTLAGLTQVDVDNIRITGNTISSTNENGEVIINPNGNGVVNVSTSRIINVVDPTNAQDAATKKYVDDQVAGSVALDLTAGTGGPQSVNLADGDINFVGGTGVTTSIGKSDDTVSVTFAIGQSVATTDSVTFVDVTATGTVAANGGDITTNQTTFNLVNSTATTVNFAGAATAVNIGKNDGTVTLANDATVGGDLTVTGDLTVNGTLTTIDTINLQVEDPLIKLGKGNTADSLSIGFYGQYDTNKKAGLFRNHVDGKFYLFRDLNANIQGNVISTAGLVLADINAAAIDAATVDATTVTATTLVGAIDGGTY